MFFILYMLFFFLLSRSLRSIIYSNNGTMNWGHGVCVLFIMLMINYLLLEIIHFGCHVYWCFLGSSWGIIWFGFHFITCTCCCVTYLTFENYFDYLYNMNWRYIYMCVCVCVVNFPQPHLGDADLLNQWFKNWIFDRELRMIDQVRLNLSKCPTLNWVNRGFM